MILGSDLHKMGRRLPFPSKVLPSELRNEGVYNVR